MKIDQDLKMNNLQITVNQSRILILYHIESEKGKFHKKAKFTINVRIKISKVKCLYIKVYSDNFIDFVKR